MTAPAPPTFTSSAPLLLAGRVVDLDAGLLRDGNGAPISVRPQAWAVLALLVRHVGRVVGKTQLLDTVWPRRVVTDGSLARAVSDLRAAFGSDGHRIIKTAARRGYLLLAPDEPAPDGGLQRTAPLPAARGPLFGRAADLADLGALMARHRLVTIVGAGGVGKTAIAVVAARSLAADAPSTSAWVDLAALADPMLLAATVARALGLPIAQGGDPLPGLLAALAPVTAWLVLDNAEHLVAGVARLTRAMLDAAPGLRVLVTSQAPLHIETEQVFRLAALDVPAPGATLAEAAGCGAVALFVEQARAGDQHFELTPANLGMVIELCRRLEGLPLAIRLAVARLPVLGLAGVVSRLGERLQMLAADCSDAPARQQTLLAALDWSHGLLPPQEQALFRRLGVFVGGFSLDLAVGQARCDDIDEWTLIEGLNVLVERGLVDIDRADPPRRYRLLETQRDYALRMLRQEGELPAARQAQAIATEGVMRKAYADLWSMADDTWLRRWEAELDNVRAALDWTAAHDVPRFAALVGCAAALFMLQDLGYELRRRAAAVDPATIDAGAPALALGYWLTRTYLEAGQSVSLAHAFASNAERAARSVDDLPRLYVALCHRVASGLVPPEQATAALSEIVALESADWPARMRAHRPLAEFVTHSLRQRWRQAQQAAEAGYALTMQVRGVHFHAMFANGIVVSLLGQEAVHEAIRRGQAMRHTVLSGPTGPAIPFVGRGARCALVSGDIAGAKRQFGQLFDMCRTVDWMYFDYFAVIYVQLATADGRLDDAARLLGFSNTAAGRSWNVLPVTTALEQARVALAGVLAPEQLAQLAAEGAGLDREAVCRLVLKDASRLSRRATVAGLTARQAEVLRLIGQGQTDKQAARTLGLSPRTVEMHVARAIDALQCSNRAEAVRIATQRGLMADRSTDSPVANRRLP